MPEFTGERVIPGEVDADLLNEHVARYTFAARLARGKRVLDAGCGAGYGTAELARTAESVVGADRAPEAVDFARARSQLPNLRFEQASCAALPHPDGVFDLVVAFEVIEHLEDWREFLLEARRVLTPTGQFIVSTPNKLYYTESRGPAGANPFHVHEFGFEELRSELAAIFPHVAMFLENHVAAVAFQPEAPDSAVELRVDAGEPAPDDSHFFVAVCAHRTQLGNPTFIFVPSAANVLRERERHIALLERELSVKNTWLDKAREDLAEFSREHAKLLDMFRGQKEDLDRSNTWAGELNHEVEEARARVAELQEAVERSNAWAGELNREVEQRRARVVEVQGELERSNAWAAGLNRDIERARARVVELQAELEHSNAWALGLDQEIEQARARIARLQEDHAARLAEFEEIARRQRDDLTAIRASLWYRLGRKTGLAPTV